MNFPVLNTALRFYQLSVVLQGALVHSATEVRPARKDRLKSLKNGNVLLTTTCIAILFGAWGGYNIRLPSIFVRNSIFF